MDDAAKHGEPLTIGVATAAEIHLRLVADDDGEGGRGGVAAGTRHRENAVEVPEAGDARAFECNGWKAVRPARRVHLELDDLDFDVVPCGVVRSHRAIDAAAILP